MYLSIEYDNQNCIRIDKKGRSVVQYLHSMLGSKIILRFTVFSLVSIILLLKISLPEHHEYTLKSFNGFISLWVSNEMLGLQFVKIKKGIYTTFFVHTSYLYLVMFLCLLFSDM